MSRFDGVLHKAEVEGLREKLERVTVERDEARGALAAAIEQRAVMFELKNRYRDERDVLAAEVARLSAAVAKARAILSRPGLFMNDLSDAVQDALAALPRAEP